MKAVLRSVRQSDQRDQYLLFAVMLSMAVGNTGMLSVLPAIGRDLQLPDWTIGLAFSFSALVWAVAALFWARRINRTGFKPMIVLGMLSYVVSLVVCGAALAAAILGVVDPLAAAIVFIAGRIIYGVFGAAAPSAAQALVATQSSREKRTKALTMLASAFGLGTIIGPALAPFFVLPVLGLSGPMFVFAAFGIATLLAIVAILPNTPAVADAVRSAAIPAEEPTIGGEPSDVGIAAAARDRSDGSIKMTDPRIWPWILAGLVATHAQAIVGQTMAFLVIDRLSMPPSEAQPYIGIVLMTGALAALLAQWGVIPRMNPAPRQLVIWGAVIGGLGTLGIVMVDGFHATAIFFAIASLGYGLLRPGVTAGCSLAVGAAEQGMVAGHLSATVGFAYVLGPLFGILLYEVWPAGPFILCAVAMLLLTGYALARLRGAALAAGD